MYGHLGPGGIEMRVSVILQIGSVIRLNFSYRDAYVCTVRSFLSVKRVD